MVGVSTALWLQRAGRSVTLVDRAGPAGGTSYGNAGVLAAASVVPVPTPGITAKAPGMLLSREQPLFLRWSYLPRLVPFLRRYLGNSDRATVERIAAGLTTLLQDTTDQHFALAEGTGAERYLRRGDYAYGYEDEKALEKDAFTWDLRHRSGFRTETLRGDEIAAYDPALAERFGVVVTCPEHGQVTDPGAYVRALARAFEDAGGEVVVSNVRDFRMSGTQAAAVITDAAEIVADTFVLTTGAWSGPLARRLGIRVPLESERGYHIEFVNPSIALRSPTMVTSGKFVATSMEGRLRCAGLVEFGGLEAGPSRAPFEFLRRNAARVFPDLEYDRIDEWMGHRPATSDSLPVIGRAPRARNVWLGYGHQHVGLTAGPKTGRWLAGLITGQAPNADLGPFRPDRSG